MSIQRRLVFGAVEIPSGDQGWLVRGALGWVKWYQPSDFRMVDGTSTATPRPGIAAILRNEYPYVIEWIAHHRVLGIEDFFIADNVSDDGTSELLAAMDSLGLIRRIVFPTTPGFPPQLDAYEALMKAYGGDVDWVAFIDGDEFLMPEGEPRSVSPLLAPLVARPDVGGIAVNWAVYGSSWHRNHAAGLITERFVRRAPPCFPNHHYKTILRCRAFGGRFHNPHAIALAAGLQTVHTDGRPLVRHERHGLGISAEVVWDRLRVNHYIVKSREEFFKNKSPKQSAAAIGRIKDEGYFRRHDFNDVRDVPPPWLVEATWVEVERLESALRGIGAEVPVRPTAEPIYDPPFVGAQGAFVFAEDLDAELVFRGWAIHADGVAFDRFALDTGGSRYETDTFVRRRRPDMVRKYPMFPELCGYHCRFPRPNHFDGEPAKLELRVRDATGTWHGPLRLRRKPTAPSQ